ncbi:hypothetical protein ANN_12716 [Periplaneta americana]|uniref:RNA-directed DNA polymerase from mobile element jockey n=1 Tax=Periplaneta americana TaxID=6978 RepID=A0ABQ8TJL0_PERAM|nr:hypothetical protein ANN_12716 [Periplaneta americana]
MIFTFCRPANPPCINLSTNVIPWKPKDEAIKYLGVHLDRRLSWKYHINNKLKLTYSRLAKLYPLLNKKTSLKLQNCMLLYTSLLRPLLLYACPVWGGAAISEIKYIQSFQNKVLRISLNSPWFVRNSQLHRETGIDTVKQFIHSQDDSMEISQNLASVAQTTTCTAAMIAIEPSSSFVPISLQRDVIDVHRSGEIRNMQGKMSQVLFKRAASCFNMMYNDVIMSLHVDVESDLQLQESEQRGPSLTQLGEAWTIRNIDSQRSTATEMRFVRRTAGYTRMDHIKNFDIMKEMQIEPITEYLQKYRQNWRSHVIRIPRPRIPRQILNYHPVGKRSLGRPFKRWQETVTGH